MNTITKLLTLATLTSAALITAPGPSASAAATSAGPLACGTVVTTDIRLTADIVGCDVYGLVVGARAVRIDLAGHTISGTGPDALAGIFNERFGDVTVRNVESNQFLFNGIDGLYATGGSDRLVLTANTAIGNDGNGLVADGEHATLRRNLSIGNHGTGILTVDGAIDGGRNRAVANTGGNCTVIACRL